MRMIHWALITFAISHATQCSQINESSTLEHPWAKTWNKWQDFQMEYRSWNRSKRRRTRKLYARMEKEVLGVMESGSESRWSFLQHADVWNSIVGFLECDSLCALSRTDDIRTELSQDNLRRHKKILQATAKMEHCMQIAADSCSCARVSARLLTQQYIDGHDAQLYIMMAHAISVMSGSPCANLLQWSGSTFEVVMAVKDFQWRYRGHSSSGHCHSRLSDVWARVLELPEEDLMRFDERIVDPIVIGGDWFVESGEVYLCAGLNPQRNLDTHALATTFNNSLVVIRDAKHHRKNQVALALLRDQAKVLGVKPKYLKRVPVYHFLRNRCPINTSMVLGVSDIDSLIKAHKVIQAQHIRDESRNFSTLFYHNYQSYGWVFDCVLCRVVAGEFTVVSKKYLSLSARSSWWATRRRRRGGAW